jgi:chemotaxis protein CheC
MSMPEILRGDGTDFFSLPPPPEAGDVVVFLHIDFSIKQRDISGYIVMLMDMPSIAALDGLLRAFIARTTGSAVSPPDARR